MDKIIEELLDSPRVFQAPPVARILYSWAYPCLNTFTGYHLGKVHSAMDWSFGQHQTHLANLLRPTRLAATMWVWKATILCVCVCPFVRILSFADPLFCPRMCLPCRACGFLTFCPFFCLGKSAENLCKLRAWLHFFKVFTWLYLFCFLFFCLWGSCRRKDTLMGLGSGSVKVKGLSLCGRRCRRDCIPNFGSWWSCVYILYLLAINIIEQTPGPESKSFQQIAVWL